MAGPQTPVVERPAQIEESQQIVAMAGEPAGQAGSGEGSGTRIASARPPVVAARLDGRERRAGGAFGRRLSLVRDRRVDWRALTAGVVLIALAVATVVAVSTVLGRTRNPEGASTPSGSTGQLFGVAPTVDVVLDDSSLADGRKVSEQWPALLEKSLQGTVQTQVEKSASFTPLKKSGRTFLQAASDLEPDSNIVLLVSGGDEGRASSLSILSATTRTIGAVRGAAPSATIVIVGPVDARSTPKNLPSLLRSAAAIGNVQWVDPRDLVKNGTARGRDGALTTEGERQIAAGLKDRLAPLLR